MIQLIGVSGQYFYIFGRLEQGTSVQQVIGNDAERERLKLTYYGHDSERGTTFLSMNKNDRNKVVPGTSSFYGGPPLEACMYLRFNECTWVLGTKEFSETEKELSIAEKGKSSYRVNLCCVMMNKF